MTLSSDILSIIQWILWNWNYPQITDDINEYKLGYVMLTPKFLNHLEICVLQVDTALQITIWPPKPFHALTTLWLKVFFANI